MAIADLLLARLQSNPVTLTYTVTRPADGNPYVAGDTIANATSGATMMMFANAARKPGGAFLLNRISVHLSAYPTNKLDATLHLLNAPLSPVPVDNAPLAFSNAQNLTLLAGIFLPGQTSGFNISIGNADAAGEQVLYVDNLNLLMNCGTGSTSLYAIFVCSNASGYTPVSGESFAFKLYGEQL